MSEKKERILILRGNSHKLCKQLVGCISTGNCSECKLGIPRSEAVERMANVFYDFCEGCKPYEEYERLAEAALDALVGDKKC